MIGQWELIVLFVAVGLLLLFGPKKIPELARGIGRAFGEFRLARKEAEREISDVRAEPGERHGTSHRNES